MEREVSTGGEPYVIVSSDTHAGLKCEEYRPYLDSALHAEFDDYVAERHEHRRVAEELNSEFVNQWEGENEWGLQGAYDPEVRDPVRGWPSRSWTALHDLLYTVAENPHHSNPGDTTRRSDNVESQWPQVTRSWTWLWRSSRPRAPRL